MCLCHRMNEWMKVYGLGFFNALQTQNFSIFYPNFFFPWKFIACVKTFEKGKQFHQWACILYSCEENCNLISFNKKKMKKKKRWEYQVNIRLLLLLHPSMCVSLFNIIVLIAKEEKNIHNRCELHSFVILRTLLFL